MRERGAKQRLADISAPGLGVPWAVSLAWKNKVLETAGYTDPRITIQIATEPLKADGMVDFYLDLKKE